MDLNLHSEVLIAKKAALEAGRYLNATVAKTDLEKGKDIKLANDRESERIIIDILKPTGISILTEESGEIKGNSDSEFRWIVDPLDGSMNFLKGMTDFCCVSIALWEGTKPLLGVINRFYARELFIGVVGEGSWLNDKPMHTSNIETVDKAVLATGFPVKRSYDVSSLSDFVTDIQRFKKIRMLGAAAIMGAFVSCGRIDAYMEDDIMLWDIAASAAIVKAAGGYIYVSTSQDYKCKCRLFANQKLIENYGVYPCNLVG